MAKPAINEDQQPTRQLLMEDYDPSLVPEVVYVQQGNKVCFFRGAPKLLSESLKDGIQIVESVSQLDLEEREGQKFVKGGKWVVEGPYQRSGVKNANGRTYSRKLWERVLGDKGPVMETLRGRGMIGHLEHPKDGRTDLNESAMLTTSLELRQDGVVWGRSELCDTPKGRILQSLTEQGVRWGVSSRGSGDVDSTGQVNEENYGLTAFDGVASPSTPGAFPNRTDDKSEGKVDEAGAGSETDDVPMANRKLTPAERSALTTRAGRETELGEAGTADDERGWQISETLAGNVARCDESVRKLCETPVEEASAAERVGMILQLTDALGRVNGLAKSEALPIAKADELRELLANKLSVAANAVLSESDREAVTTLQESAAGDDSRARFSAYARTARRLQERVDALEAEKADLARQLSESDRSQGEPDEALRILRIRLRDTQAELTESHRNGAEAWKTATELRDQLQATASKLEAAQAAIVEASSTTVAESVGDAVRQVIESRPGLVKFHGLLALARDADAVRAMGKTLLAVSESTHTDSADANRPASIASALPKGRKVVSESAAVSSKPSRLGNPATDDPTVRAAAAALHKLLPHQQAPQGA